MIGGLDAQEEMYAPDKPDDCSLCHFWNSSQSGCGLGRDNCYYLIREAPKVKSECDGCPYGILLDRMNLSARNGWTDDACRVYIIFTLEETMAALNCGNNKATKLYNELEKKCGLIERKRQGLGKPNLIYVKNFITGMDGSKLIYNTKRRLQHGLQCNRNSNAAYISEKIVVHARMTPVFFDANIPSISTGDIRRIKEKRFMERAMAYPEPLLSGLLLSES